MRPLMTAEMIKDKDMTLSITEPPQQPGPRSLEDDLTIRFKLAAAWTSAMFLYAYADIINFVLEPGALQEIQGGEIGGMEISGATLFGAAAWMTMAALMIAASALLSPRWSRRVNIGYGGLSTVVIPILALTSDTWAYYYLFNFVEVALTGYIVWLAIKWPTKASWRLSQTLSSG